MKKPTPRVWPAITLLWEERVTMTTGRTLISGEFKGDNADKVSCIRTDKTFNDHRSAQTSNLWNNHLLWPLKHMFFQSLFFLQSPCGRRQKETGDGGHRTDQWIQEAPRFVSECDRRVLQHLSAATEEQRTAEDAGGCCITSSYGTTGSQISQCTAIILSLSKLTESHWLTADFANPDNCIFVIKNLYFVIVFWSSSNIRVHAVVVIWLIDFC